ncbi:MAG: metal-dependent hydrolase [Planctomycetes bacterium]|nr:metal-dependent hydrolase [Planctomycetota bacterium]
MTLVGHSLIGLSVGALFLPRNLGRGSWIPIMACAALLANLPDFDFPSWGHKLYLVSHSIFVLSILAGVLILPERLLLFFMSFTKKRLFLFNWFCFASHLLLDTLYSSGSGLRMFWPISKKYLHFPISFFQTVSPKNWSSTTNMKEYGLEFLVFGAVLGIVLFIRAKVNK